MPHLPSLALLSATQTTGWAAPNVLQMLCKAQTVLPPLFSLLNIAVATGAGLLPAYAPRPTVPPLPPPFSQQVLPGVVRHFNIQPNHKMIPDAMSMTVEHISNGQHSFQRSAPPTFELPPGGLGLVMSSGMLHVRVQGPC